MVILLDVKKNNSIIYKVDIQQNMSHLLSTSSASLPACLLACLPACQSLPFRLFDQTYINFTISSFDSLNASVHTAYAASRVMETQNLMLLRSLSYVICC